MDSSNNILILHQSQPYPNPNPNQTNCEHGKTDVFRFVEVTRNMIDKDHNKTNTGGVQATKVTSIYLNPTLWLRNVVADKNLCDAATF